MQLSVAVGSTNMKSIQWQAGEFGLLDRSGENVLPVPPPTRHWAQFEVPPPLQHTFRPVQPALPAIIPLVASSIVVAPLLLLCFVLFVKLGTDVTGLFDSMFSILFVAGISATVGLGVWFWMRMRLVDLFPPLAGLAVFLVFTGHQALRGIADKRLASDKELKAE